MKRVHIALCGALASLSLLSCQSTDASPNEGAAEDSVRVAMRITGSLPDSSYFKAKNVRIQFSTNTTVNPVVIDTILSLNTGRWLSPTLPKSLGYTLQVTGIDSTGRATWSGSAQGTAQGNDKVVGVLNSDVPLAAIAPLEVGTPSTDTGAIDFPKTVTFQPLNAAKRYWSLDGKIWRLVPDVGLHIDSSMTILVQTRSDDTLTGAPFSAVAQFSWSGKTVAMPTWSIAGNRYFPGAGTVKSALTCATTGAKIQWSTNGDTWTDFADSLVINPALVYQARAIKAHQPTSAVSVQTWQWLSSDSAALTGITVGTATLSPVFEPSILSYVTDSVWGQAYVTVSATPKGNGVNVTCNGAACAGQQFPISDTGTFIAVATSINGTAGLTYTVRVPKSDRLIESDFGIPWNPSITFDTLLDTRDGQKYRTVKIGTQTWMAQNLNYKVDSSSWPLNKTDSGAKYGRLYTWNGMMDNQSSSDRVPSGVQGVCPIDWHIPSDAEWDTLISFASTGNAPGTLLKSLAGWNLSGNGVDRYGFRALPAGNDNGPGEFSFFWSATESTSILAWYRDFFYAGGWADRGNTFKSYRYSIRCIKDKL